MNQIETLLTLIAQQHLETLRDRLQDARDLLSGEQDAMAPAGARR